MLLVVILGAITLIALRIAGVGNLKRKPPSPSFVVSLKRPLSTLEPIPFTDLHSIFSCLFGK